MVDAAFGEQRDVLIAEPAQKIGGCLKCPVKVYSAFDEATRQCCRAPRVDKEIGIDKGDLIERICLHKVNNLANDARHGLRIESTVVENHIGAVIARIGATDAGGVRKLSAP